MRMWPHLTGVVEKAQDAMLSANILSITVSIRDSIYVFLKHA